LDRRGDVVQRAQTLASISQLDTHPEPLAHGRHGDAVDVVSRLDAVELGQRAAVQLGGLLEGLGRVAVQDAPLAGQSDGDGELWGELAQAGHVALGDLVDGGGAARGQGLGLSHTPRVRPAGATRR